MNDQETKLREEIEQDAAAQAAELLTKARAEAEAVAAKAVEESAALRRAELAKAEALAEARCRAILSGTGTEAKRRWMLRREDVIASALADGLKRAESAPDAERAPALESLLAEAVAGFAPAADGLVVSARPADAALLTPQLLAAAAKSAGLAEAAAATWTVVAESALAPGLVVTAPDGRRRSDQTFAARLVRLRPELRMQVAELVRAAADRKE